MCIYDINILTNFAIGGDMDPADIEDLFEELEDLSDSGPDLDTLSILSTPKPSLRPFFSSSRTNMIHEGISGSYKHFSRGYLKTRCVTFICSAFYLFFSNSITVLCS